MSFAIVTTARFGDLTVDIRRAGLICTIILGFFHFSIEIRQFIWRPKRYISDFWNYFDLCAHLLPIITSIYWLSYERPPSWLISLTNLSLDLKFMFFLRVFKYFGKYFAIILGVAKKVFSFLLIIFIVILSFSHSLYVLLRPTQTYTFDQYTNNDDPNNPWNLVDQYITVSDNNTDNPYTIMKEPDKDTNMFIDYSSSMLAMYNFLAGDNSAISPWSLQDDPYLTILVVVFSFIVVVYLMNLFIGLLSNAIEENNTDEAFFAEKARIITEIELFYLLPNQRRWKDCWYNNNQTIVILWSNYSHIASFYVFSDHRLYKLSVIGGQVLDKASLKYDLHSNLNYPHHKNQGSFVRS
ncbi:2177_t:CDS:2 [Entrophospora sp. SA101]|nr:2177_t:CDS:2 [Entrophospora sp. SA101]